MSEKPKTITIGDVRLNLSPAVEKHEEWIGQRDVLKQLLACWLTVHENFLLAGQSNMQGQGVVDLDHPKYYNGGQGILNRHRRRPGLHDLSDRWFAVSPCTAVGVAATV